MSFRIALAQINPIVGDLSGNQGKILAALGDARRLGADIVAFPEMALTGYPPEDLLLKSDFLRAAMSALHEILPASAGLTAIIGTVYAESDLNNVAAILHDGRLVGVYRKQYLPNYGVFDENRYFQPGQQKMVFNRDGIILGVSICEDIWYPDGPPTSQALQGDAQLLINISASPYHMGKGEVRERMLATRAVDSTAFVAYCNMVGGQDELVFDGHSLVCDPQGEVIVRARQFEEQILVADLDLFRVFRTRLQDPRRRKAKALVAAPLERVELGKIDSSPKPDIPAPTREAPLERAAEVYRALTLGTRDYVRKSGFRQVVLGLSGGIDSSLTAAIAADALGAENVVGVAMPTRYSSSQSLKDADLLAKNLRIQLLVLPIDQAFQAYLDMLTPVFAGRPSDVTEENIQPRIRGTTLMALSNKFGWLVLTTGNKSEVAVGYSTLYGDTAGGFSVIKDVPKMLVYELARYRNKEAGWSIIPDRVLEKAPSAELRPNQLDSDSLPEYPTLDAILHAYVEEGHSSSEIVQQGFNGETVRRVIRMVDRSEYKRRQSPPGVKITPRAFGKDWRLPITNRFSDGIGS